MGFEPRQVCLIPCPVLFPQHMLGCLRRPDLTAKSCGFGQIPGVTGYCGFPRSFTWVPARNLDFLKKLDTIHVVKCTNYCVQHGRNLHVTSLVKILNIFGTPEICLCLPLVHVFYHSWNPEVPAVLSTISIVTVLPVPELL